MLFSQLFYFHYIIIHIINLDDILAFQTKLPAAIPLLARPPRRIILILVSACAGHTATVFRVAGLPRENILILGS